MNALEKEFIACVESKDTEKIKSLLKSGFPVNRHINVEKDFVRYYTYPLIMAVEMQLFEVLPVLLGLGANVNAFNSVGFTAAMAACAVGQLSILKLLVQYKADISSRDFFGNTILHIAGINGELAILKYCINDLKIPVIVKNLKGQTPLFSCIEAQEQAKSLDTTEKLQETIEYLWKVEDDFKKNRIKNRISNNSYIKKHPRFNIRDLAPVPILPDDNSSVILGNNQKKSIQGYLKAKHIAIYNHESFIPNNKFIKLNPIYASGSKSSSMKQATN
jgi:Ankyrin repeats (3 copies)